MSEPTRLVEEGSDLERALLRAWTARQPSAKARLETIAVLGVGGAVTGAGLSLAPKATAMSTALLKWLGIGGGVLATAGVATYVVQRSSVTGETRGVDVVTAPRAATPENASPVAPDRPLAEPAAGVTPTREPVAPPPVAPSTANVKPTTPTPSLSDEVLAIDRARRALGGGDASSALTLVDAYDARFPNGSLREESLEIRVEAFFALGRRADAEKGAAKFLEAHPSSPYARTIRALEARDTVAPSK